MSQRSWWRVAFLGLTAVVLGMEVFAAVDGNEQTDPWTDLIVTYIPGELFALAFTGLAGWLGVHFGRRYLARRRERPDDDGG